jgi:hypothetical protein
MGLSNLSFSATNINAGAYADRPAQCKVGDMYICTDQEPPMILYCKVNGSWDNQGLQINGNIFDFYATDGYIRTTSGGELTISGTMLKYKSGGSWYTVYHEGNALVAMSNSGSYYGNSTPNRAIPHGLGKTPKMVRIFKNDMGGGEGTIFEDIGIIRSMYDASTNTYTVTKMDDTNFYVGNSSSYPGSYNNTETTYVWLAIL